MTYRWRRQREPGGSGGGFVTITDTFTRADSAVTLGSTEGANIKAWTPLGGGSWGISSNQGYNASVSGAIAVVAAGVADCTVSFSFGVAPNFFGSSFRAVDATNYLCLQCEPAQIKLFKFIAGASTQIGSTTAGTFAINDVMAVVLSGNSIIVKQNGTTVITTSDAQFNTATQHGLYNGLGVSSPRWDNFSVTVP